MAEMLVNVTPNAHAETMREREFGADTAGMMRQLLELTRQVLNCCSVGVVAIEPETEMLRPVAAVGLSPEHEQVWHESTARISLSAYLHDPLLIARLRANEVVLRANIHAPLYMYLNEQQEQRPRSVL